MLKVIGDFMIAHLQNGRSFEEIHEALLAKGLEPEAAAFWISSFIKMLESTQFVEDDNPDLPYKSSRSHKERYGRNDILAS